MLQTENPSSWTLKINDISQTFNLLQEIRESVWGVSLGGVSADIEGGSWGGDPPGHDSWVEATSLWPEPRVCPNTCGHRGPGGSSRTWPRVSQETLLTPGHDSGRVRWRGVRRSPHWVLGENSEDLRVGELWLRRRWNQIRKTDQTTA